MKNIVIGFLLACAVVALAYGGYDVYRMRLFATAAATYLYAPTDLKDSKGQALTGTGFMQRVSNNGFKKEGAEDMTQVAAGSQAVLFSVGGVANNIVGMLAFQPTGGAPTRKLLLLGGVGEP